jgi:hypothetical protein
MSMSDAVPDEAIKRQAEERLTGPPPEIVCPIFKTVIIDPVLMPNSKTCDKEAIRLAWLDGHGQ